MLTARLFEKEERERIAKVYADIRDRAKKEGDEKTAAQFEEMRKKVYRLARMQKRRKEGD